MSVLCLSLCCCLCPSVAALVLHSFGLVSIPVQLRVYLVVGSLAVVVLSFMWEQSLRHIFPAAKPPSKGYMVHAAQLKGRLGAGAGGGAVVTAAAARGRSKKEL
jgi:hypothetical protein